MTSFYTCNIQYVLDINPSFLQKLMGVHFQFQPKTSQLFSPTQKSCCFLFHGAGRKPSSHTKKGGFAILSPSRLKTFPKWDIERTIPIVGTWDSISFNGALGTENVGPVGWWMWRMGFDRVNCEWRWSLKNGWVMYFWFYVWLWYIYIYLIIHHFFWFMSSLEPQLYWNGFHFCGL